jgi:hypothetical protein
MLHKLFDVTACDVKAYFSTAHCLKVGYSVFQCALDTLKEGFLLTSMGPCILMVGGGTTRNM